MTPPLDPGDSVPDPLPAGARPKRRHGRAPKDQGLVHSFRAFRHRDYTIFWFGALASNTGTWLSNLTVPYILFTLTGSALWVAYATLAQLAPAVLLGPLGGHVADRFNRRRVLLATQASLAVVTFALWGAWASGWHSPYMLLGFVSLIGILNGINMPSWQSFVNDLVPREDLMSAVALNSMQFNAARAIGPAIAGVLLATLGPSWAFFFNFLSFGFVLAALLCVSSTQPPPSGRSPGPVLGEFIAACRYILGQRGLLLGIVLSVMVGLFGNPLFQLTVVFADTVYGVGATGLGMLNAALGVGAVLVAPLIAGWSKVLPISKVVKWAMLLYGVGLVALGFTPSFGLAIPCLVLLGACFLAAISGINTSVQLIVAERFRGRVLAVRLMFFTASMPVGSLLQGWVADLWGVQTAVVLAGMAMLACLLVLAVVLRGNGFSRLDDPQDTSFPKK